MTLLQRDASGGVGISTFAHEFNISGPRHCRGHCIGSSRKPSKSVFSTERLLLNQINSTTNQSNPASSANKNGPDIAILIPFAVIIVVIIVVSVVSRSISLIFVCTDSCWNCYVRCKDSLLIDRAQVQPQPQQQHATHNPSVDDIEAPDHPHSHAIDREGVCKILQRQEIERMLVTTRYDPKDDPEQLPGSSEVDVSDCAICLNSFKQGEEVAQSANPDCQHLFHTNCIVEWLTNNPGCPACRRPFLVKPADPTDLSDGDEVGNTEPQCVFP